MINKLLTLVAICALAACTTTNETVTHTPKTYTIEQFYQNKNVFGGSFSPDASKLLVSSNESGIYNAMALPVDGSPAVALTQSDKTSIFAFSYFPNDERILYGADNEGDEISHIYMLDNDGVAVDLTPAETAKSNFFGWTKDLTGFYYTSNERDENYFDLYRMDATSFESEMLYQNDEGYNVSAISDDSRYLALVKSITTNNSEMYLYDRGTEELTHLTPHEGDMQFNPQYFSSDNSTLYYLTDENSEFQHLVKYDIANASKAIAFQAEWDVWYAYESYGDKYRVIGVNADGKTEVKLFDIASGAEVEFPNIEGKSISSVSISRDEKHMRLTAASSASPSDIFVYHFENGEYKQLTDNLNPEIAPEDLVEATVVRFKSFDGLEVPGILYKPHTASADNKVPALIWVHGGPGGQDTSVVFGIATVHDQQWLRSFCSQQSRQFGVWQDIFRTGRSAPRRR